MPLCSSACFFEKGLSDKAIHENEKAGFFSSRGKSETGIFKKMK